MITQKIEKKGSGKSGTISRGAHRERHLSCVCSLLLSALFLIIFLLFTSLDTSGTWNVNRLATKTSTQDTYSPPPGLENFILAKNWSQDHLFVVTNFLSILSMSSKFSTGHVFHLFKLIFFVDTSFVLLSEEKISNKEKEKVKELKKQ